MVNTSGTGLSGGLGSLAAVMMLVLMGVVLGWVCSYHKRKRSSSVQKKYSGYITYSVGIVIKFIFYLQCKN